VSLVIGAENTQRLLLEKFENKLPR
jgi:hypothetical protein